MSTLAGNPAAIEQGVVKEYDPRRGPVTIRRWRGPRAALEALKDNLIAAGWTTRLETGGGPNCSLEASIAQEFSGGAPQITDPVDTWELTANVSEKDILRSDSTQIDGLSSADIKVLRDLIKGKLEFDGLTSSKFTSAGSLGWNVAKLIAQGLQSVVVYQPIIRHTKTVSRNWEVPASLTNVGNILLTSTLVSLEDPPASISNNLSASGAEVTRDGLTFRYGWLKTHPTITDAANERIQIVQEWQWGLWPTLIYTVV